MRHEVNTVMLPLALPSASFPTKMLLIITIILMILMIVMMQTITIITITMILMMMIIRIIRHMLRQRCIASSSCCSPRQQPTTICSTIMQTSLVIACGQ